MAAYMEAPGDDAISLTLSRYDPKELLDVVSGLKHVLSQNPQQARAMLAADQDLTYAILQAELLMGLIDESVVADAMKAMDVPAEQADVQPRDDARAPGRSKPKARSEPKPKPKPAARDPFAGMTAEQVAAIKQIISVTDEQLAMLPAEHQAQVRALRAQYSA